MSRVEPTPLETPTIQAQKTKYRGDRGNVFKRAKLIAGRSPKDMGIKKTKKLKDYFYAFCDHRNKKNRLDCKQKFGGWTVDLVMGNKAIHEAHHDKEDRKAAELAGVT